MKKQCEERSTADLKEAEKNADRIINDSLVQITQGSLEVEELKKQASIYRARFRTLVEAQLELLSHDGWDSLEGAGQITELK